MSTDMAPGEYFEMDRAGSGLTDRRLLIDLSEVVTTDYGTGIHRVVRNMTRSLLISEREGWSFLPVVHQPDGEMHSACGYVTRQLAVPCQELGHPLAFGRGDTLLMLDSAWEHPGRFLPTIERVQSAGGRAGGFVYDLIPLRFPQYCVDFMPLVFERWLRFVVAHADFLVCISRAVADDLRTWIVEAGAEMHRDLRIGHIHLGSEMEDVKPGEHVSDTIRDAMGDGDSVLMVGTVEPRKRHDLALAAFEQCWDAGTQRRLVIVGKQGWNVDAFASRLRGHPENGTRLHWIECATDADLRHAYSHCACLLQASDAEGFGLPIVEAAHYGKPLLLSELPVFREIAGERADYFVAGDVQSLVRHLLPGTELPRSPAVSLSMSWQQSADQLLRLIGREGHWDHLMERSAGA